MRGVWRMSPGGNSDIEWRARRGRLMEEIICRFAKGEDVKWVSHLETMRVLERALRRARIAMAYTEGFNPRPRLAMGPALSAGMTSEAELVAIFLAKRMDPEDLKERLNVQLPPAFRLHAVWAIPSYGKKQTLGDIDTADYIAAVKGPADAEELARRAVGLLSCSEIPFTRFREKKTQELDLRPLILKLSVSATGSTVAVNMSLRTGSGGGVRPQEVLEQLGITGPDWEVSFHRVALYASRPQAETKPKGSRLRGLHGRGLQPRRQCP
jgi:radical SAM-linked protein